MNGQLHPVYVDGPLAGQDFPVDSAGSGAVYALQWEPLNPGDPGSTVARPVIYNLRQYAIFGRIIWVGTLKNWPDEPSDDDLAEHLLSNGAKAARCITGVVQT